MSDTKYRVEIHAGKYIDDVKGFLEEGGIHNASWKDTTAVVHVDFASCLAIRVILGDARIPMEIKPYRECN